MKTISPLFALTLLAAIPCASHAQDAGAAKGAATAPISVKAGKALYAAGGKRLGAVYRVRADGAPQLIVDGKLVTVPVSTLTLNGGKVITSMTTAQLLSAR